MATNGHIQRQTNGTIQRQDSHTSEIASRGSPLRQAAASLSRDMLERQLSTVSNASGKMSFDFGIDNEQYRRLQAEMQSMAFKVRALEEKVDKVIKEVGPNLETGPAGRGVAFTARLKDNVEFCSQQTLRFDDVVTNVGEYYDSETGIFKVPYTGRYLFSLTVRAQDQKQVHAEIVADPIVIGHVTAGDTKIEQASASVTIVVSLYVGDEVYVRETKTWTGHFYGEGYTAFTGILLQ